jgi:hypothetical protein
MDTPQANMPNPAAVYCEQQGYRVEIRTATDGSQTGYCIFPDDSECDEWMFYRGECGPSDLSPQPTVEIVDGWKTYRNETMGFSFQYPADATIQFDNNGYSIYVNGPMVDNNTWPVFMIAYPNDREEYRVPPGADLKQWMIDHNLYVDQPQPDVNVAGTTAIHTRFSRSQQAYANDRYFFVHNGQLFSIGILHTGDKEDWNLYNRFLSSFQFDTATNVTIPTAFPTMFPIDPADYQGWWTYTHANYGFSIMLPEDWVVEEVTTNDPVMNHAINMHPEKDVEKQSIRLTFRRVGEDVRLWPTGVGQGEFILQGTLDIAGQPAQRILLVCPTGEVTSIWYHQAEGQPNITRGELEFGFIYSAGSHCEPGQSLNGKVQRVGEMIIASLKVP